MIPIKLVINNFSCYERSEIDFNEFSCALILGKVMGNDSLSNGVGKTSIFKAIEYVLFNESEEKIETVIRDDADSCKVILYFEEDGSLYRVSRSRTKKGIADLSLHKRTENDSQDIYTDVIIKDSNVWKDISGRRAADTEKELEKLLKTNYKSFRNTLHFVQHDFTGIATLTPEKRKSLLKDILQLLVYSKLEKMAKDKLNYFNSEIQKNKTLIESLGDPANEIVSLKVQIEDHSLKIKNKSEELISLNNNLDLVEKEINDRTSKISSFESNNSSLNQEIKTLQLEISKSKMNNKNYSDKNLEILNQTKNIIKNINQQKDKKVKLSSFNFEEVSNLESDLNKIKEEIINLQITSKNLNIELEDLKIPIPENSICKHCRQPLTEEHVKHCKQQTEERISLIEKDLLKIQSDLKALNTKKSEILVKITQLNQSKKELDALNSNLESLKKDYDSKKHLYDDYLKLIKEITENIETQEKILNEKNLKLEESNTEEYKKLSSDLAYLKNQKIKASEKIQILNKELANYQGIIAVLNHKLENANNNKVKLDDLNIKIKKLEDEVSIYPSVINSFSSLGIPNLLIQSVLDDWQIESNKLLEQIRPGLQLSFYVEKEKKGEVSDTLEIEYFLNNKRREYRQLSGAQRVSIAFALKLGLAFLLQNMFGFNIKLLLLDEIDQSLDKAGTDAFADIVKFFQKDFKILVITHNDRLKDKFQHAIVVEQDQNMISNAKVMSSW